MREAVWEFWTKCEGLRGVWVFRLVKRCICTFFFFEFRPDSAVSADIGRYGPSRPILVASVPISAASAPISVASARFGTCYVARRGPMRQGRAVCGVPAASPRRTRVRWPGSCVHASQVMMFNLYEKKIS